MADCNIETPMSGIPQGLEKYADKDLRVDLLGMVRLLLDHLTPALCQAVFDRCRSTERERKWAFASVNLFWAAMIIRHPPSISHGLDETRKGRGRDKLWPKVQAEPRAFYKKCQGLRPHLFRALYQAFLASILPQAAPAYASWMGGLLKRFPEVLIVDGSRLDAVCKRLGILRREQAKVLPGCLTVFYDLFRGVAREVLFFPHAAEAELPRSRGALASIAKGALLLGDRLYASVKFFHLLAPLGLWGLFHLNGTLKVRRIKINSRREGRGFLEDALVEVGCGVGQPAVLLRRIRYRGQGRRLDLLTSVLDPAMLTAQEALSLYGLRWTIERMFLDLKETLDLHTLYASHPNLAAQQVYAAAMVHAAFRIAQAKIAAKAKVLPEQISPQKLFPKLAQAANDYCVAQATLMQVRQMNPGLKIKLPGLGIITSTYTRLGSILAQHRSPRRHRRKFSLLRKKWKSILHIRSGPSFLKSVSVG